MAIDVSKLWDYGNPAESEARFREALATASPGDAFILQTQIARSHGMRKDFERVRAILATLEPQLTDAPPEGQVRYWLELGRSYASAAHPPEAQTETTQETARRAYLQAFDLAKAAQQDYLAIDALHMMAFVDTSPEDQLNWDLKAIQYMEASTQAQAKQWEGSLRNNVGYALHQAKRFDEALAQFKLSLAAHERSGKVVNIRVAQWMMAWTYRAMGRLNDALEIQLKLEQEWATAGEDDPYVFEELAQIYKGLGDEDKAKHYAEKLKAAQAATT